MSARSLTTTQSQDNRYLWVDRTKGIGILLVVLGHSILGLYPSNLSQESSFLYHVYLTIYSFHMPLFFFLSGLFSFKWSKQEFFPAMYKKVKSLVKPYVVWSILFFMLLILFGNYANNQNAINLLMLPFQPSAHFWFLYVLFFIFLTYFLCAKLLPQPWIIAIALLGFIVSPFLHFWVFSQLTYNFIFFAIGSSLGTSAKYMKASFNTTRLVMLLLLFVSLSIFVQVKHDAEPLFAITLAIALSGIFSCVELGRLKNNILLTLGTFSLVIYVIHPLFTAGVRTFMRSLHTPNESTMTFVIILLSIAAGCLGPMLIYYLASKSRIQKYLF